VRFALGTGRVVVRWLGLAASLQTVCAAPVPRAVNRLIHHHPDTRRRLYGGWFRAKSRGLGSDEVTTVVLLAVVILVGAIGASDGLGTDLGRSVLL
jgi:hypothetical protein